MLFLTGEDESLCTVSFLFLLVTKVVSAIFAALYGLTIVHCWSALFL